MDLLDWALLALVALAFGLALYKTIVQQTQGKELRRQLFRLRCGLLPAEIKPPQIPVCKRSVKANAFTGPFRLFSAEARQALPLRAVRPRGRPCAGIPCI